MTSLIFWGPYLAHKSIIQQKREKQRVKNYERWEGLRDDYDEQRKIARDSRSLDIQRTGQWDGISTPTVGQTTYDDDYRGVFTLRDQQEANDARTSWRPQEAWDTPRSQAQAQMTGQMQQIPTYRTGQVGQVGQVGQPHQIQRHVSSTPALPNHVSPRPTPTPLRSQRTGATWDDGLPTPLQVSRRSFDEQELSQRYHTGPNNTSRNVSRQPSQSGRHASSGLRGTLTPSTNDSVMAGQITPPDAEVVYVTEQPKNEYGFVDPVYARPATISVAAGGRMAELIERGY